MTQPLHPEGSERRKLETAVGGGTTAETLAGLGAGTLAIIGLAGILPVYMTSVGVIAAGGALFIEGLAVAGAHAKIESEQEAATGRAEELAVGGGFGAQSLGGAAAVVLGILALTGIMPGTLLPVAVMVLGAALLLGGPARAEFRWSALERYGASSRALHVANQAIRGATGLLSIVGIGAIVLGILALTRTGPARVMTLVALLAVASAEVIGGSAMLGRLTAGHRH